MAVILCSRGHYYDENKFFQCPYCGIDIRAQINSNDKNLMEGSGSKATGLRNKDTEKTLLLPKEDAGNLLLLSSEEEDKTMLLSEQEEDETILLSSEEEDKTYLISNLKDDRDLLTENVNCPNKSAAEYDKSGMMSSMGIKMLKLFRRRKNDKF